jgi:hypothetical protein
MDTVTRMFTFFLTVNATLLPIDMRLTAGLYLSARTWIEKNLLGNNCRQVIRS